MKKTVLLIMAIGISIYFIRHKLTSKADKEPTVREKLIGLIEKDDLENFKTLLESNPDSTNNYLNILDCEFLWKAAAAGRLKVVKFLVFEKNMNINCNEGSALFYASSMGNIEMVQFLIQNEGQIRPHGYAQETCLHAAAGTNPDLWVERQKYDFAKIDMLSVVKMLIANGAKVTDTDKFGETPLHKAAFVQNYAIVQYLLGQKSNVNCKDDDGNTPLHNATFTNKDNSVCALLLANGANASSKNNKGQTPILWGQGNIDTSTIHLFVRYSYDPIHDVDNEGHTLLQGALGSGQFSTVDFLLDHKADVNAATNRGTTPLHIAAGLRGMPGLNILKRLLKEGAFINPVDSFGHTPLFNVSRIIESDHGTYYPDSLIVNFLKRQGAHE